MYQNAMQNAEQELAPRLLLSLSSTYISKDNGVDSQKNVLTCTVTGL
jgi:hypothetical protein